MGYDLGGLGNNVGFFIGYGFGGLGLEIYKNLLFIGLRWDLDMTPVVDIECDWFSMIFDFLTKIQIC
jgi:hypothetical protein